jgi:hypothetical protein
MMNAETAPVQLPPQGKITAEQLKAARDRVDLLWAKIRRGTAWERFTLSDYSDGASIFENEDLAKLGDAPRLDENEKYLDWLAAPRFIVTFFPSESAQSMRREFMTLAELRDLIQSTSKKLKDALPWLKLASFSGARTGKNCLRSNAAMTEIHGIELDYDGKQMKLDAAIAIAEKAKLRALIYTSASYTDEAPKWRIVLPTSKPLPTSERAKLVARVHGLYGGIFDGASFTLSQSYYFGSVKNNPKHRAVVTEGRCIDLCGDLDGGALGKDGKPFEAAPPPEQRGNGKTVDPFVTIALDPIEKIQAALDAIPNTADIDRKQWFDIGQSVHDGTAGSTEGLAAWIEWTKSWVGWPSEEEFERCEATCTTAWKSMNPREITVASLYALADKVSGTGWRNYEASSQQQDTVTTPPLKTKLMQTSAEFVAGFVPPDYLIDGLLQRRYVYSLTGPTGSGKTAIALLIAAHVAMGRALAGREVEKGRVLFFAGENPDDVRARWIKLCEEIGVDADALDVVFMPFTPNLSEKKIREQIDTEAAEHGPFSLLIVDTSAAYYTGNDENDNVALGNHARLLRTFIKLPGGPTVLVTCHPTKTPNMDNLLPRGGGAFLAEVDGNLVSILDRTTRTVEVTTHGKFRGPEFAPFSFKLVPGKSPLLVDTKGREIWTVFARPISDEEVEQLKKGGRSDQDAVLRAMLDEPGRSLSEIANGLLWQTAQGDPNKQKVQRIMKELVKAKLVTQGRDDRYGLTPKGETEAQKTPENMVKVVKKEDTENA